METQICKYCNNQVLIALFRKNRKKCKNCEKKYGREYRNNEHGKQKAKTWSNNNKARHTILQSEWAKNNRNHLNNKYNVRTKSDHNFKIKKACQRQLLLNLKKTSTTMKYLSCDIDLFIKWLSFCFDKNMNMNNHGSYWHLDHVIPISLFDLQAEEEIRLCFHYLNYMPLPAKDNISKQNKIIYSQLITHMDNIIEFHIKNELSIDKKYFELLARHLTMPGISLEF
jgi:hypothetical protein